MAIDSCCHVEEIEGCGEHILVIDDEENIRALAEKLLVYLGEASRFWVRRVIPSTLVGLKFYSRGIQELS